MKEFFENAGLSEEEVEILIDYCERTENSKERALDHVDEILADYEAK